MDTLSRRLTDAAVRSAKPSARAYKLADGGGLFLQIQPGGAKLWRDKFRMAGTEGLFAIGSYPDIGLAAAREEHRKARELVAAGVNRHDYASERRAMLQDWADWLDTLAASRGNVVPLAA